jgi:hypothetical protein
VPNTRLRYVAAVAGTDLFFAMDVGHEMCVYDIDGQMLRRLKTSVGGAIRGADSSLLEIRREGETQVWDFSDFLSHPIVK